MNKLKALITTALLAMPITVLAGTYTIQPGDTMWQVAAKHTQGQVTTHQMLAAIHELNSAKLGANIDNVPAGLTLDIPTLDAAAAANSSHATALLSGNSIRSNQSAAQAQALMLKIDNIQKQINQTVKDIEATQAAFEMHE